MNSNEDELQKAINDIPNTMLNETPVAPEGVAPAPVAETPAAPVEPVTPVEPVAQVAPETANMVPPTVAPLPDAQNLQTAPVAPVAPVAEATPEPAPAEEVVSEVVTADIPDLSMPEPVSEPESADEPAKEDEIKKPEEVKEEPKEEEKPVEGMTMDFSEKMEIEPGGVKEKALRDLMPILSGMNNIDAEKKFKIYCDMMEVLGEKDIANDAYEVATQIGDDNVRGEALLKLVDLLDK